LQRLALAYEVRGKYRKGPVRLAVIAAPEDAQVLLSWVEAADDVGRALEGLATAGLSLGPTGRHETKQHHGAKLKQGGNHPLRLAGYRAGREQPGIRRLPPDPR